MSTAIPLKLRVPVLHLCVTLVLKKMVLTFDCVEKKRTIEQHCVMLVIFSLRLSRLHNWLRIL